MKGHWPALKRYAFVGSLAFLVAFLIFRLHNYYVRTEDAIMQLNFRVDEMARDIANVKDVVAIHGYIRDPLAISTSLELRRQYVLLKLWRACGEAKNLNFVFLNENPFRDTDVTVKSASNRTSTPFPISFLDGITNVALFERQLPAFQFAISSLNLSLGGKSNLTIVGVFGSAENGSLWLEPLVAPNPSTLSSPQTRMGTLFGLSLFHGTYSRVNISVLYERKNVIDPKDAGYIWQPWSSSGFPKAFLPFEISPMKFEGLRDGLFNVPSNFSHFNWQKKFAKFIACDENRAAVFAKKSTKPTQLDPIKDAARIKWDMGLIITLQRQMASWHRSNWIFAGTLLGWYRQCSLIPHDLDMDTVSWISDFSPWMIPFFKTHPTLQLYVKFGLVDDSLEFKMGKKSKRTIDLFWLYPHEGKPTLPELKTESWLGIQTFDGKYTKKVSYYPSIDSICSTDLHGYLVYIPCDVWPLINIEYGKDWFEPNPKYDYKKDAYNWRTNGSWTARQWRGGEVYKVYQ